MNILCVLGTRPEAIKFAPVIQALQTSNLLTPVVCITSQHRSMLSQVLEIFDIRPAYDLDIMRVNQDLYHVTSSVLLGMADVLKHTMPAWTLVQGDTTTTFASALAAHYAKIPVAHIEAGLRTYDKWAPFPEESNRRMTTALADLHFAPTVHAQQNLLAENVLPQTIIVTGNTAIDALFATRTMLQSRTDLRRTVESKLPFLNSERQLVLITAHRRENFGEPLAHICRALRELALSRPAVQFVYPVHLNPNVRSPVEHILGPVGKSYTITGRMSRDCHATASLPSNLFLIEPVDYFTMIYLLDKCRLVLTDSGGIQEEAASLGKPTLVLRETTERPEGIEAGIAQIVGSSQQAILAAAHAHLDDARPDRQTTRKSDIYGDGHAAQRIVSELEHRIDK